MKKILKPIVTMRESYEKSLEKKVQIRALPLNMALISNPFLKGEQQYKKIHHQFLLYNKRAISKTVEDQYQVRSYEKFHEIMGQLANLVSRKDQLSRLQECVKWWNSQKRIIKQRKDLGVVKYKTDKQMDKVRSVLDKLSGQKVEELQGTLPNDLRFKEVFPYQMGYRTIHQDMEVPIKRLPQYKRKIINLNDNNLLDDNLIKKGQKVTYPMPKKIEPPQSGDSLNPENNNIVVAQQGQINQAGTTIINPQSSTNPAPEGEVAQPAAEDPNKAVEQAGQDLGMGLGQQPGQAEEQPAQQEPQQDKLAPKNKIYTNSIRQEKQYESLKKFQKPYLFYRGNQSHSDRRMQQRAILKQQYSLQIQRQQSEFINKAHNWATQKSKIDKQIAFKLSSMKANNSFTFSYQQPEKKEMLSPAQERRYGVYQPTKPSSTAKQIDFSQKLPGLNLSQPLEKQIKRDRLNSLKNRFSTILNIRENNEIREKPNGTMCQTSPQRKSFSMILQEHSLQKERMNELEQIQKIKESLGKYRVNINIRTLAQALVPDSESYRLQSFSSPPKMLPSNPFFVEVKKKKKKK